MQLQHFSVAEKPGQPGTLLLRLTAGCAMQAPESPFELTAAQALALSGRLEAEAQMSMERGRDAEELSHAVA